MTHQAPQTPRAPGPRGSIRGSWVGRGALAAALAASAIGTIAALGWVAGNEALVRVLPDLTPMRPTTALGVLLAGLALFAVVMERRQWAWPGAVLCAILGGSIVGEFIFDEPVGLDRVSAGLFDESIAPVGPVAPNTGVCFLLVGLALTSAAMDRPGPRLPLWQALGGSMCAVLGVVALFGYGTGLRETYGWGSATAMALNTAVVMTLLGAGLVLAAWLREIRRGTPSPRWLPLPVGVGVLGATLLVWRALVDIEAGATGAALDRGTAAITVLLLGIFVAGLVAFAVSVSQRARAAAAIAERTSAELRREVERRREAEIALVEQAEKLKASNEELEQFAHVASHDLQEPLRMVTRFVQLLQRRYEGRLDDSADTYIKYAVDGSIRMQNLIQDLLRFSKLSSRDEPLRPTDLGAVLEKALVNLSDRIAAAGALVTRDDMPEVMGAESQLVQLFQNLVGNGIKFNKSPTPEIHVGAQRDGSGWNISVRDNGIGIDPKHHDRIFTVFQRLHARDEYGGTGIGLAICKKVVQRHGGHLSVDSRPGEGTRFTFTLPAVERELGDAATDK